LQPDALDYRLTGESDLKRRGRARTRPLQSRSSVPHAMRRSGSEATGDHAAEATAAGRARAKTDDLRPVRNIDAQQEQWECPRGFDL